MVKSNLPQDDTGQHPRPDYMYRSSLNQSYTGEKRNSLVFPTFDEDVDLSATEGVTPEYGLNRITETLTGHTFEMDDTPGNERILIKHNSGAGIELCTDGSICISALNNRIECTGGDQTVIIIGNGNIHYKGNLDFKVDGEFNIDCLDFNLNVKNDKNETVGGDEVKANYGGITQTVKGSVSSFVTENVATTVLGSSYNSVKKDYTINTEGDVNMPTKGNFFATSADIMNLASDNLTLSANNMTVQGGAGTIGGTGMLISAKGAVFEEGVTAPTFHGDLTGRADEAISADAANYATTAGAAPLGAAVPAEGWTNTNTATPTIKKPTAATTETFLTKSAGGIKAVTIDHKDGIKNYIDRTADYDGIF